MYIFFCTLFTRIGHFTAVKMKRGLTDDDYDKSLCTTTTKTSKDESVVTTAKKPAPILRDDFYNSAIVRFYANNPATTNTCITVLPVEIIFDEILGTHFTSNSPYILVLMFVCKAWKYHAEQNYFTHPGYWLLKGQKSLSDLKFDDVVNLFCDTTWKWRSYGNWKPTSDFIQSVAAVDRPVANPLIKGIIEAYLRHREKTLRANMFFIECVVLGHLDLMAWGMQSIFRGLSDRRIEKNQFFSHDIQLNGDKQNDENKIVEPGMICSDDKPVAVVDVNKKYDDRNFYNNINDSGNDDDDDDNDNDSDNDSSDDQHAEDDELNIVSYLYDSKDIPEKQDTNLKYFKAYFMVTPGGVITKPQSESKVVGEFKSHFLPAADGIDLYCKYKKFMKVLFNFCTYPATSEHKMFTCTKLNHFYLFDMVIRHTDCKKLTEIVRRFNFDHSEIGVEHFLLVLKEGDFEKIKIMADFANEDFGSRFDDETKEVSSYRERLCKTLLDVGLFSPEKFDRFITTFPKFAKNKYWTKQLFNSLVNVSLVSKVFSKSSVYVHRYVSITPTTAYNDKTRFFECLNLYVHILTWLITSEDIVGVHFDADIILCKLIVNGVRNDKIIEIMSHPRNMLKTSSIKWLVCAVLFANEDVSRYLLKTQDILCKHPKLHNDIANIPSSKTYQFTSTLWKMAALSCNLVVFDLVAAANTDYYKDMIVFLLNYHYRNQNGKHLTKEDSCAHVVSMLDFCVKECTLLTCDDVIASIKEHEKVFLDNAWHFVKYPMLLEWITINLPNLAFNIKTEILGRYFYEDLAKFELEAVKKNNDHWRHLIYTSIPYKSFYDSFNDNHYVKFMSKLYGTIISFDFE